MVSLGCDKNLVDSERMLGILTQEGFEITGDEYEAEAAVINTCCFIEDAKKESIERIFELAELKKTGKLRVLVAAGCMAQRYRSEILSEIPEIDAIVGTTGIDGIARAVSEALKGQRISCIRDESQDPDTHPFKRVISTGGHYAYLKIAEGCDKHCTYCAIPLFRGRYRSFPMEDLLNEARNLAEQGVRELILVAQETTLYGTDLYGEKSLHRLIRSLSGIPGIQWIRLLYCYPEEIYPELIREIAGNGKVCHYLDLPVQHASDQVLKRMNRRTSREELEALVESLREAVPDIVLRTTLISGFPGETEEDHKILIDFVKRMQFDRLGVFTYSKEEDTPAAKMKPQIRKGVKNARRDEIMLLQQKISLAANRDKVGRNLPVFVEGRLPEEGICIGRSYGDAPGVDGFVFFEPLREHMSGDFVTVHITDASEYDLHGVETEESEL